jgi:hypothetical protein
MRVTTIHSALVMAGVVSVLLSGCGGSGDAANLGSSFTDITVERGPLLHASVTDADGNVGSHIGNGVYRFNAPLAYPIRSVGGYIDTNRNGRVDEGDVKTGAVTMKSGTSGSAVTLCSTLASNEELKARLLAMGFTETQLLNNTPSQDRMIAALSDEIYKYAVTQGIGDVARITLQQLDGLVEAIQARVTTYRAASATAAALEQQLLTELGARVDAIDATEAAALAGRSGAQLLVSSLPASVLNDDQKRILVYMWNEEKLAKDVYLALNAIYPSQQLYNIATTSETQHEAAMQALLEKYNLSVWEPVNPAASYSAAALAAVPAGAYTVTVLQSLYDTLYAKGGASARDSLEVGCMVEVTDINDFDHDLALVDNVLDARTVFENLRAGSYSHYWAFDRGLKSMGIANGCCSLGAEYCHPEYPDIHSSWGSASQ